MNYRIPLSYLKKQYINKKGFRTDKKIVVIESDDWGSIRMPSFEVYNHLCRLDDSTKDDAFLRNDSLESESEVKALFDLLKQYKDTIGNHPCFTANFAVANPNFDEIELGAKKYVYETFLETYKRYFINSQRMLDLFEFGKNNHLFVPQLHAREHLNISRWMNDLYIQKKDTILAFENNLIGVGKSFTKNNRFGYMDALNYDSYEEYLMLKTVIGEAVYIFEQIFGYKSRTFVASCFVWTPQIEQYLHSSGIELIQTQFRQNICPSNGTKVMLKKYHYTGQKNKFNQLYSIRNCEYEPSYYENPVECARNCFTQVKDAFENHKPAIINSHRFNYIGKINPLNAERGLQGLDLLLKMILAEYPDVRFMSTVELLDEMKFKKT